MSTTTTTSSQKKGIDWAAEAQKIDWDRRDCEIRRDYGVSATTMHHMRKKYGRPRRES